MDSRDGYAEAFIESLRARSQHTARSYRHCIRRFLAMVGKRLEELTVADAAGYLKSLDSLSPASRAHHISAVRSFLKFLQGQGVIATTPLDVLRRPRVAITSMTRYLGTQEEAEKLLAGRLEGLPPVLPGLRGDALDGSKGERAGPSAVAPPVPRHGGEARPARRRQGRHGS